MKIFINDKPVTVDAQKSLGKGMEADVYQLGNLAVKIFKDPNHPDLLTDTDRKAAKSKIDEHQNKLRMFPSHLPQRVVTPLDLVKDSFGTVVGYTMRLVDHPRQVRQLGEIFERTNGIDPNQIVSVFIDLHNTVGGLHTRQVVIGDFNDLNILASGSEAHVIDADSFQFGNFPCRMYTEEFVDPKLCDPSGACPILMSSHTIESDWYAYAVMLFKTLLCVGPFGGVYKPLKRKNLVLHTQRPLVGISVFNHEVRYPKKAIPFRVLPDDVLDYFQKIFDHGHRAEFPIKLLSSVKWSKCSLCNVVHARSHCPYCQVATPQAAIKEHIEVRRKIKSTTIFTTSGRILCGGMQDGHFKWLCANHGKFYREDGLSVCNGVPEAGMRFRISGDKTIISRNGNVLVIAKDKAPVQLSVDQLMGHTAMFDASSAGIFWEQGGAIFRGNALGLDYDPDRIGHVLEGQTLFWVGCSFGVGFYYAGLINVSFVFDVKGKGINDSVTLPKISGQIIGAKCFFSSNRAAMLFSFKDGPRIINRCVLISSTGDVIGVAEGMDGDSSWLSGIRGKCVVGDSVMSATDEGIIKVDFTNGVVSKETKFDGSESFVDSGTQLFVGSDGLYCMSDKEIKILQVVK